MTHILIRSIFKMNFSIPEKKKQKKIQNFEACSSGETPYSERVELQVAGRAEMPSHDA